MLNERAKKLVALLPQGFEAALVGTPENRFYLLDFDSGWEAGTLLVLPDKMVYFIDSRYIELAQREVSCAEVILETSALDQVNEILQQEGVKKLYAETGITLATLHRMQEKLQNVEIDTSDTLSKALTDLRQIKDTEEIARMRRAQQITDDCFTHILGYIKPGMREVDVMLEMERYIRSHGAEKLAFETICVAGPNTSLPHGEPGEYQIQPGDLLTMDFGAKYKGYCTDMTRTIAVGEPGEEKRRVYNTVLQAHLAGIAAVRDGADCFEVDKAARDLINSAGYEGKFGHGLGHAVGIEIHEEPRFSPKSKGTVHTGMMMTVEPGIYLPGQFGCRIEDTVLVTADGCQPLPHSKKELIVI